MLNIQTETALYRLQKALDQAEAVLIGAGSGLSSSAGFVYDGERFERYFADFEKQYGFHDMYAGGFYPFKTPEERWAYWSRFILINRYMDPPKPVYQELRKLVEKKDYFVLTSNIDGQFIKAGFDPQRVFEPQGSIALLQCSRPCCDMLWDGEPFYRQIARDIDPVSFSCPTEDIPHCPHCGAPLVQNLRGPDCFIPRETMKNRQPFEDFMKEAEHSSTLFLELGVGFNSPGLIRHYFQRLTWLWPNARLIRFNRDYPSTPKKLGERALPVGGDLKENLLKLDRFCQEEL